MSKRFCVTGTCIPAKNYMLEQRLKSDNLVISLSFEAVDEYFASLGTLAEGLMMDIAECLKNQNASETIIEEWNEPLSDKFPLRSLGMKITRLCKASNKKVVLMIDEVDKSSDNQIFLSFLGLRREKYLKCQQGKDMLQKILFDGIDFPFKRENPIIDLGVTFGFLKDKNGIVAVANRIFETQLYDTFLSEMAVNDRYNSRL